MRKHVERASDAARERKLWILKVW